MGGYNLTLDNVKEFLLSTLGCTTTIEIVPDYTFINVSIKNKIDIINLLHENFNRYGHTELHLDYKSSDELNSQNRFFAIKIGNMHYLCYIDDKLRLYLLSRFRLTHTDEEIEISNIRGFRKTGHPLDYIELIGYILTEYIEGILWPRVYFDRVSGRVITPECYENMNFIDGYNVILNNLKMSLIKHKHALYSSGIKHPDEYRYAMEKIRKYPKSPFDAQYYGKRV